MTDEQFNLQLQFMYDNLTTERFNLLLKAVDYELEAEPNDFINNLYQSVSKNRRLTFKQFKSLFIYIKKVNTEYKQF